MEDPAPDLERSPRGWSSSRASSRRLDDERAAELVREASELAAQAGRAVEGALRGATDTPEA